MNDDTATAASNIAAKALHRLQADGALRTVDVAFAELLRDRLGADATVALAGALAMRAVALGHSSFALADAHRLIDALGVSAQLPACDDWHARLQAQVPSHEQAGGALPLHYAHGRIALRRYARYEQALAERLHARAAAPVDASVSPDALRRLFAMDDTAVAADTSLDTGLDHQALAAALALRRRLLLITGGPGTGKTTTVARLLAVLVEAAQARGEPAPRIALAAPTGRAAARLGEAIDGVLRADLADGRIDACIADVIPRQARTLHRLLGWQPGRVAFRHTAAHPLPADVVVVDEASMVDLPLMAKLVDAVHANARLVLIGDPDQLPAVEAGDVLGGLCAASGDGLAWPRADAEAASALLGVDVPVATDTAPLAGARVQLVRGWRQAGAAGLRALADAVQRGDRDAAFELLASDDPALVRRHGDVAMLAEAMREQALPAFAAVRDADDPTQALQRAGALRVLAALRRGPYGAEHWNAWCAAELGAREAYFHGRLIAIAANSERHGLFNGDLGVIWHDTDGDAVAWFAGAQGLRAWRPAQLPAHASAYATTVHKAQGSEFERIALILPDADARVLSRELLYTALTRARRGVWLWSDLAMLERALERRTWRDSGLRSRIEAVGERQPRD